MKRRFFEPIILYVGVLFFESLSISSAAVMVYLFISGRCTSRVNEVLSLLVAAFMLFGGYIFLYLAWDRLDVLKVNDTHVKWMCIPKGIIRMYYDQCNFIGVENFDEEGHLPIIRGDENSMIYFSKEPFPEDKRGHINHAYCSASFVKFRYTDELAEALFEVLPPEKQHELRLFYNRMKNRDYQLERMRKRRRSRKKGRSRKKR